jgi:hypothetical protein
MTLDRRTFLAGLTGSLVAAGAGRGLAQQYENKPAQLVTGKKCWLDVAAPFVLVDPKLQLSTELLLTATCFPGTEGFRDSQYATEYEVLLYDARGKEINLGSARRTTISAMRPTVLRMNEVVDRRAFWGSAKIRVAPRGNQTTHAGDLFSAGFVRWNTPSNFDNVHAHPAAPAQARGRFFYSMPFPALDEYHCAFAVFNPSDDESAGVVRLVEPRGRTVVERRYRLRPHETILYSLVDLRLAGSPGEALAIAPAPKNELRQGGVVAVINDTEAVAFAYTLMKGRNGNVFTVEHPLHFADAPVKPARTSPYGPNRTFPAEALLFTPMLFNGKSYGGVELESRLYLSASRWREEALWVMPFVTDGRGTIAWVSNQDDRFAERVAPAAAVDQGLLRLGFFQSCRMDARTLPLPPGFSGSFATATAPPTSHSLMKVEVRAKNWDRACFTHFRPGGPAHKRYRSVAERGGLASDYIISGCQVRGTAADRKYDSLLAVMNIEFTSETLGHPKLELFGPRGFIAEKQLGEFPPLACRHLLLSELFPDMQTEPGQPLTVRMVEQDAMMVVSVLHMDYERRDIAMDHGSDRHSTYLDYGC